MTPVIIESPYAGNVETNVAYARRCMVDCLKRGEAPFASHLLYTQVLDDTQPGQRELGVQAGLVWGFRATLTVVYIDLGVSSGMIECIKAAVADCRDICVRSLDGWTVRCLDCDSYLHGLDRDYGCACKGAGYTVETMGVTP